MAQSERVQGAYTVLYTLEHKTPPPTLQESDTKFRNKVIHRGKIPTRQESEDYGQKIIDAIYPVLAYLKANEVEHVRKVVASRIYRLHTMVSSETPPMSMTVPGIISINRISPDPHPILVVALREIESRREKLGW